MDVMISLEHEAALMDGWTWHHERLPRFCCYFIMRQHLIMG